ncbi:hypothetical protein jhhlp_007091 [Lomentospora prolificans]|uniref:Alpha-1,3-mannosyltransferase CMT1 n=1 Tax=Lomentospora prolificans TaxID=41688 RepID=A0A2N3N1P6_9PEZI|nr:hypothetical protein jhhlp_007091 [Lomentospora prolificans]
MKWKRKFACAGISLCLLLLLCWFDLFYTEDPALGEYKLIIEEHLSRLGIGAEKDPEVQHQENLKKAPKYVASILDPSNHNFKQLSCPPPNKKRYEHLIPSESATKPTYIFALNLINVAKLLPRLMGSIVETLRFLGPENCVISIVEGHSKDGTMEILEALGPEITKLGAEYHFLRSEITPNDGRRIAHLAELRNMALGPLLNNTAHFVEDPTIIFLNDVAICSEDILELIHQRRHIGADMTCGMDWSHIKRYPTFYDAWVARSITGNSFFYINPEDISWDQAHLLFFDDPVGSKRLDDYRPVQVFACWNGAVVFSARPLLKDGIRFRDGYEGECRMGEPTYFCKDLWKKGYGKIAVVPTVNLEYDNKHGAWVKHKKGWVHKLVKEDDGAADLVEWRGPPEKVLCMPGWDQQTWVPWDEHTP